MAYTQVPVAKYGPAQSYVLRIVLHGTVSPCQPGGARAIANYFANSGVQASAHYVVDPNEVVQCVPENQQAWHDGYNVNEIGIELCDPQSGPGSRWQDAPHQAMLRRAAALVNDVASRWSFARPLKRGVAPLDLSVEYVTGHVDIAQTTHTTDHTDPGPDFPWDEFMAMVNTSTPASAPPSTLLAGKTDQAPGACTTPGVSGRIDVVARGTDGAVWHRVLDAGKVSPWESLGGFCWGSPAISSFGPGRYDVVCRGKDNRVWHKLWSANTGWTNWEDLGGAVFGVTVVSTGPDGEIAVIGTGTNGQLYIKSFDGHSWSDWK